MGTARALGRFQTRRVKHCISTVGGVGGQCCRAEKLMAVAEVSTSARLEQQAKPLRPRSFLRPETVSPRLDVPRHIPRPPYASTAEPPVMADEAQVQDEAGVAGMRAAGRVASLVRDFLGSLVRVRVQTAHVLLNVLMLWCV